MFQISIDVKIYSLIILLLLPLTLFAQTGKYIVKGSIKNYRPGEKIYFMHFNNNPRQIDSAIITNGTFIFSGDVGSISNEPDQNYFQSIARLCIDHKGTGINFNIISAANWWDMYDIYIEPGVITVNITDSAYNATSKGPRLNQDHADMDSIYQAYFIKLKKLQADERRLFANDQNKWMAYDMDHVDIFKEEQKRDMWQFVKTHPWSPVSLYVLKHNEDYYSDYDQIQPIFERLSPELKNTEYGKNYSAFLDGLKLTRLGADAPAFSMNDQSGIPITLASFKGKYVLVDFWASWCGPCRQENPSVVKAYEKFKDKNFVILGVSLDQKKDDWVKAIAKDDLYWTQVSDLESWDNAVAKLYSVHAIPQNFLIDPQGKIIAKNLFGDELTLKLTQILGSN